MFTP
ncbi:Plant protein of unknown function D [Prunus dulcis]|jgi:hypothetical protein